MSVRYLWRRLTAKPVGELAGRFGAVVSDRLERRLHARARLSPVDRLAKALGTPTVDDEALLRARRTRRPRFFPSLGRRDDIRRVMAEDYGDEVEDTRRWATRAFAHEFHFFGREHRYDADIAWQLDPVSRRPWPAVFASLVPHAGEGASGDVKDVWELSRQQYLVDLGKAYFLEGNSEHAAEIRRLVRSWIEGNPYATGVNWASPLEPAYRTFSWLWAYEFTIDDPDFSAADHALWAQGFLDHGRFLHRHLELYASPYNHLIGEATALYLLGTMFPEFSEAAAWRKRGRRVLEERLRDQFYADGGTVEQATLYHHATLGFYVMAALIGQANNDPLSGAVWHAIEQAIEFSMHLLQPDGQLPVIGDTDDARPIQLERRPFFDFRAYQALGAVLFSRGDLKAAAGRFHEDALWLLGPDGLEQFARIPAASRRHTVALADSGYFVSRSDWSPTADYVCFDCGEQAGGLRTDDVPSAAHGHADCLSVTVYLAGRPVLVDSGFFTYNGERSWERHFRETAAHNTARVNGLDQASHVGKMAWSQVPTARLERGFEGPDGGCLIGSHDGFVSRTGIRHRRHVWYRPEGRYLILLDDFDGPGGRDVDIHFHFAPEDVRLGAAGALTGESFTMRWVASFPIAAALEHGGDGPNAGWIAPSLGVRVAAYALRLSGRTGSADSSVLTVLAPSSVRLIEAPPQDGVLAMRVEGEGWVEDVRAVPKGHHSGAAHMTGLQVGRAETRGGEKHSGEYPVAPDR